MRVIFNLFSKLRLSNIKIVVFNFNFWSSNVKVSTYCNRKFTYWIKNWSFQHQNWSWKSIIWNINWKWNAFNFSIFFSFYSSIFLLSNLKTDLFDPSFNLKISVADIKVESVLSKRKQLMMSQSGEKNRIAVFQFPIYLWLLKIGERKKRS